ncbi:outer membrane beta-barrel protein [Formosa haliotis]|uniref:outer membrane beta-barrel protein n=1 Tax=Formosa haliotis TaxID=1555194 RepID=UPI000825EC97|nr:outer membrane beta-barrel protein [Formosa haliotis]
MSSKLNKQKYITGLLIFLFLISVKGYAQKDEDVLRIELSFGGNHAFTSGFAQIYASEDPKTEGRGFNLPTLNFGGQYMFSETLGAKLDIGFSRIFSANDSPEFKINYTRINAQVVYDYSRFIGFIPEEVTLLAHAGPGFSAVRPLGTINDNDQNYLNAILGTQILYMFSRNTSVFFDASYIHGFSNPDTYAPPSEGLGAFNGSMLTFTVGVSLSLSGCYFCN